MKKQYLLIFLLNFCTLLVLKGQISSTGKGYSLVACPDGTVQGWGLNVSGQLGIGTTLVKNLPAQVVGLTEIKAVSSGGGFALFLKKDGTVWGTGVNSAKQLGNSPFYNNFPVKITVLADIKAIAAGLNHSLFLKKDGTVLSCGRSSWIPYNPYIDSDTPQPITDMSNIIAIATGNNNSFFLKNDSTVWACGDNYSGALGDGTDSIRLKPIRIDNLTGIIAVSGGGSHTLFLKNDGTVWACGSNQVGQLGDSTFRTRFLPVQINGLTDIIAISAGLSAHSLFLKNDGTVWTCGMNFHTTTPFVYISPVPLTELTNIKAISAGFNYSLFVKKDGTVWGFGANEFRQLGIDSVNYSFPLVSPKGVCNLDTIPMQPKVLSEITAFPNPTTGYLTIEGPNNLKSFNVTVFNILGRAILSQQKGSTIDLRPFNSGLYFLTVKSNDQTKIIKVYKN